MAFDEKVAFVTEVENPEIADCVHARDDLLALSLQRRNVFVVGVPWDDDTVDWTMYDCLIMRSAHNYFLQPDKFISWLHKIKKLDIKLLNTPEIIEWNMDKRYLFHFQANGIQIPGTVFVEKGDSLIPDLVQLAEEVNKGKPYDVIIKPCVSASSNLTYHVPYNNLKLFQSEFCDLVRQHGMLVQEYLPEIKTSGEYSLFYIDKDFSHAVQKIPTCGDFRVQKTFGGLTKSLEPSEKVRSTCDRVISLVSADLLYARVDVVETSDKRVVLMELEVTEPRLHFDFDAEGKSYEKMADLILDKIV